MSVRSSVFIPVAVGCLAAAVWLSPARGQDQDKAEELKRFFGEVQSAEQKASYQGEQTVYDFSADRVSTTRFRVQYAYPYRKREAVDVPTEGRVVMLEDGKNLWSYYPSRRIVVKEPLVDTDRPINVHLPEGIGLLARNYQVYVRGPASARGGTYRIVEFVPRRPDRPRREIWLEETRKIPVRVYISRPDGGPSYRSEMDGIDWNPSFAADSFRLRVPRDTRVYEIQKREGLSLERVEQILNRPVALPMLIPMGYTPYNIILRSEADRKHLQVVYTDGLSSFSVFYEWGGTPRPPEQGRAAAAEKRDGSAPASFSGDSLRPLRVHHYGLLKLVTLVRGGQKTVCVGDLEEAQLREIAGSLPEPSTPVAPAAANPPAQETHLDR